MLPYIDMRGGLTSVKHFAAMIDPQEFGGLLRTIDGYCGDAKQCVPSAAEVAIPIG